MEYNLKMYEDALREAKIKVDHAAQALEFAGRNLIEITASYGRLNKQYVEAQLHNEERRLRLGKKKKNWGKF